MPRRRLGGPCSGSTEDRSKLYWKRTFQHYLTILAPWMNGHSVAEIAVMLKMEEKSVIRCIEDALQIIHKCELQWRGIKTKPAVAEIDPMPKTACSRCEIVIEGGEYRVFVLVMEKKNDPEHRQDWILGERYERTYCADCVANMPEFALPNLIKSDLESRTKFVLAPSLEREDVHYKAVTGRGGEKGGMSNSGTEGYEVSFTEDEQGDEELPRADREANEFTTDSDNIPAQAAPRTVESIRREALRRFLNDPRSRGKMHPNMRRAVTLFVEGNTQREIAGKTGVDQGTVSRRLNAALKTARA